MTIDCLCKSMANNKSLLQQQYATPIGFLYLYCMPSRQYDTGNQHWLWLPGISMKLAILDAISLQQIEQKPTFY